MTDAGKEYIDSQYHIVSGTFKADAGNFQTGQADGVNESADGGNWSTGEIDDDWNQELDGGNLN